MNYGMFENKKNIFNYIFFLFPFTIYSSFAIDFSISLIAIYGFFFIFKNYKNIKFDKYQILPFVFLYVILIINLLFSNDIQSTISRNLLFLRFIFFALFFIFLLQKKKLSLNYLILGIEINVIFLTLDGLFQYYFGFDFFGNENSGLRLSGPFSRLILGSVISKLIIILSVAYYVTGNLNLKKIFLFIIPGLIIIFLSGERSALYISLLCVTLIFFYINLNKFIKISFLLIAIFLSVIFLINNKLYFDRYVIQTLDTILDKNTGNTSQYKQHFVTSIEIFKDNIITGAGIKNFRNECEQTKYEYIGSLRCSTHSHNIYFEIISEMGLLGLIFLTLIFYIIYLNIIKNINYYPKILVLIPFLPYLFPFQTTGSFFNNYISSLFWFTFVTMLLISKYEKK